MIFTEALCWNCGARSVAGVWPLPLHSPALMQDASSLNHQAVPPGKPSSDLWKCMWMQLTLSRKLQMQPRTRGYSQVF